MEERTQCRSLAPRTILALFGPVYFAAVAAGYGFYLAETSVSVLWPASGVYLAALLLVPTRRWPLAVVLAQVAEVLAAVLFHEGAHTWRVAVDPSNDVEALLGAFLIRRVLGDPLDLSSVGQVFGLTILAVVASNAVGALLGAWMIVSVRPEAEYWTAWQIWWCADAIGVATVAPVILAWCSAVQRGLRRWRRARIVECCLLVAGTLTAAALTLGTQRGPLLSLFAFPSIVFPFLLWAAFRFDSRVTTSCSLAVAVIAVASADLGRGPFFRAGSSMTEHAFALQVFLFTLSLSSLVASVALSARRRAEKVRRDAEQRLWRSQRLEVVGQLAGGMAHDFNNDLTVILGYADPLSELVRGDARASGMVGEIRKAARRGASLTRQLLALGRRTSAPEDVDLNAVVLELRPTLESVLGEGVDVWTSLAPDVPLVRIDPRQVEHVILNLAVNARDAMPLGGTLTIETAAAELDRAYCERHPEAEPGLHAALRVSDEGTGIAPDVLERIFEPFFTTKTDGRGSGFGLPTVRAIVEQNGGSIAVHSRPGEGTTFEVFLPVRAAAAQARPASERAPASGGAAPDAATILLVEEQEHVRELARSALEEAGYRVIAAAGARPALEAALDHRGAIDLLVVDLRTSGIGGIELARRLFGIHPETQVLFAADSAPGAEIDPRLLAKPFTREELLGAVRDALAAGAPAATVAT